MIDSLRRFCLLLLLPGTLGAATFTVTTTADSGAGSLRQAIMDANATAGADTIAFDIAGDGVHTIAPLSALPEIIDTVTIDGYTQPGSSPNTLSVGDDAVLLIELSGTNHPGSGFVVRTSNLIAGSTIRGLVINDGNGVTFDYMMTQQGNNHLFGCFLGTSPDGTTARPPSGVFIRSWTNSVGGSAPANRNLIAGPVSISSGKQNSVTNNYIGTDASGTAALAQPGGVSISSGAPLLATLNSVSGNLISGNLGTAVSLGGGNGNSVSGNLIGTDSSGVLPLANGGSGVYVTSVTGLFGPNTVSNNTVAYNTGVGVVSSGVSGGKILGNSIHDNAGVGISADASAPEPPFVTSAVTSGKTTTIAGTTNGTAGSVLLEFFSSPACDPSGFGEGAVPLGTLSVEAGSPFTMIVDAVAPGQVITATASGNTTSAFSACVSVTDDGSNPVIQNLVPASGSASGGDALTVSGVGFLSGASLTVGGVTAAASVVSEEEIDATAPALLAGSLNDVTVTNPNASAATLPGGWFADFLDVPQDDPFHSAVEQIFRAAVTAGCGGGLYCRDAPVRRDQMAAFLLKAKHGAGYVPPECAGIFTDVPCSSQYAPWIEQLLTEGITGGCGEGIYCPDSPVRRDQMAVFLLKGEHGPDYVPPGCLHAFPDVPCPSPFADWIEQLAAEDITGGCDGGNYCPDSPNTRGQMAVFLVKTFLQP